MEKLVARNDRLADSLSHQLTKGNGVFSGSARIGTSLSKFHCVKAPNISVAKCLEKIYKYTNCSPSCFVVAYTGCCIGTLTLSWCLLNVQRLLVTSVMVASKIMDDVLDLELLILLDFGVMVSSRVFETYSLHLEKEMLVHGTTQKIERAFISNPVDDATEISVENTASRFPLLSIGLS
ncbi:hypothetical protein CUMW_204880 [Citrus unshiu]|uniref:Uncharacterized protein n=1 Tax=Citrus unshiu TaxID=55188 RepID=A0A2H5Q835_CITUN|nr:hypothetical protein CUMW_204880 [Citrus unshiu]